MKKSNNNDLAEEHERLTPIRGSFEPNAVIGFWTDITGRSRGFATREEALAFIETRRPAASGGPAESYLVNPAVAMSCHMAHASARWRERLEFIKRAGDLRKSGSRKPRNSSNRYATASRR